MRFRSILAAGLVCATAAAAAPRPAVKPSAEALALARAVRDNRSEAKGVEAQIAHLRSRLVALAAVEAAGERGTGDKRSPAASTAARATSWLRRWAIWASTPLASARLSRTARARAWASALGFTAGRDAGLGAATAAVAQARPAARAERKRMAGNLGDSN